MRQPEHRKTWKNADPIVKKRRPRWLGYLLRMDDDRLPQQSGQWELDTAKRKPGRPQKNWNDAIRQDHGMN